MTHLCTIPGCRDLDSHLDDCDGGRCRGCRPRAVESGYACTSCRNRLTAETAEVGTLHAELVADSPDAVDWSKGQHCPVPTTDPSRLAPWLWTASGADLTEVMPSGPVRVSRHARLSGTRAPASPVPDDRIDLAAVARPASRALLARGVLGLDSDQVGTLSTATILDSLVRTWRDALWPDQRLPLPTVPVMVDWLAKRLGDACDRFDAIDEYAQEIRDLRSALRGVLGLNAARPELCHGVPCRACDRMLLYRDGTLVECGHCWMSYSERDYREWVALLDADTRARLKAGELVPAHADRPQRVRSGSEGNGGWLTRRAA